MISFKGTFASSFRDCKVSTLKRSKKHVSKTIIYVRPKPGITPGPKQLAIVQIGQHYYTAALGRSGITRFKKEGDGATPQASMRCLFGFWRSGRSHRPQSSLTFLSAKQSHGWCDASDSPNYNAPVQRPFNKSHETLQRDDRLYNHVVVLDWNIAPITGGRQRGRGSAIFLHMAKEGYTPTEGCIALAPQDLMHLSRRLNQNTYFKVL